MHELSIVASIVESVLEFVETRQIRQVLLVRLAVGELTQLAPDQLQFCYESIANSVATNARRTDLPPGFGVRQSPAAFPAD